ncbi:MAG: glycosyltransferase family 1 protein [Dysgonomonas sp.]
MKILLLGEYSNLHWTLAQGLRKLGHDVTVASGGDRFKSYKRDINLERKGYGLFDSIKYGFTLSKHLNTFKGYDIVQIINPSFLDIKAEKNLKVYQYLKKNNRKIFLGAFGTDYFSVRKAMDINSFRYSEYHVNKKPTNFVEANNQIESWIGTAKELLNKEIADTCDGIISCLYEYYVSYLDDYREKLVYIPEPINLDETVFKQRGLNEKIRFFIGIQKLRSRLKGTDVLYKVLKEVNKKYPKESEVIKVESVPYSEYVTAMSESDIMLDQLYSYTPAMNAFAAMAQGLVIVGGGEPESYEILNETELKPIINVIPDEKDIFNKLEGIIINRNKIPDLSLQSRQFVEKHHDYVKIAQQYVDFWRSK